MKWPNEQSSHLFVRGCITDSYRLQCYRPFKSLTSLDILGDPVNLGTVMYRGFQPSGRWFIFLLHDVGIEALASGAVGLFPTYLSADPPTPFISKVIKKMQNLLRLNTKINPFESLRVPTGILSAINTAGETVVSFFCNYIISISWLDGNSPFRLILKMHATLRS